MLAEIITTDYVLFTDDPQERNNLIDELPEIAEEMEWMLAPYEENRVDTVFPMIRPRESSPNNYGGFWSPGWCDDIEETRPPPQNE